MSIYDQNELTVLAEEVKALSEKYDLTPSSILRVLASQVSTLEELKALSFSDLDSILQEALTESGG